MTITDDMVDRFLAWPLPETVCADLCASDPKYSHPRSGTNLLTAVEARQMLEHVLAAYPTERGESGWLVENGEDAPQIMYRTIEQGLPVWTADPNKAIRFARRADAEMFCAEDNEAWRVAEHIWD